MTEQTFERMMRLMAATWPARKPTAETAAAYWLVLHQLDDSVFEAAVAACLESCNFYPVPAEIREKAMAVLNYSGALPAEGEQAWSRLMDLLRYWSPDNGWCAPYDPEKGWGKVGGPNGYYGAPSPLDELTEQTVRALGGLGAIKYADGQELSFLRRDFLAFYGHKREAEIAYGPNLLAQPLPKQLRQGEAA